MTFSPILPPNDKKTPTMADIAAAIALDDPVQVSRRWFDYRKSLDAMLQERLWHQRTREEEVLAHSEDGPPDALERVAHSQAYWECIARGYIIRKRDGTYALSKLGLERRDQLKGLP